MRWRKRKEIVDRDRENRIDDNMQAVLNILDREFPEQTIPIKATIREAIDIFYKVNAGGVALTDAELALAQISGYWPQARELFKKKLAELEKVGFVFKLDFLVYVLLGCLYQIGSDWPAPGSEDTELGVFMGPEVKSWRDDGLRGSSSLKLCG